MSKTQTQWDRLKITRERSGHTKTSLAKASGYSLSYINDLETGRREPNPSVVLRLAQTLNVPISFLEKEDRIEGRMSA